MMGPSVAAGRVDMTCDEDVVVNVTGFSLQEVCDRFPGRETQLVEMDVMILIHTSG